MKDLTGDKNPFFGKTHSDETKAKIGAASKGRKPNLGRKFSEESKRKMSESKKGISWGKHSLETKEKMRISSAHSVAVRKGKPLSDGHKKKLSEKHILNGDRPPTGFMEKNSNWKGGISYRILCLSTLQRDDYTCQICGLKDKEVMDVDHKIPKALRPDLEKDIENLWTLCANCHRRKTKRDWEEIKKSRVK